MTKPEADFNFQELMKILTAKADNSEEEGWATTNELVKKMGISVRQIRRILWAAKSRGMLEVRLHMRAGLDDVPRPIPVYRVKKQA